MFYVNAPVQEWIKYDKAWRKKNGDGKERTFGYFNYSSQKWKFHAVADETLQRAQS